jgi:bacterioferritin
MDRSRSIELLNEALGDELQAIYQYMFYHFHLADQGLGPLADLFKRTAIEEMLHAETVAERILFLKGDIVMVANGPVATITDPAEMLADSIRGEEEAVEFYNKAAIECGEKADSATKQIFERLIADEEGHLDQFDTQLENIKRFGPSYLALQSFGGGAEGGGEAPA